MAASGPKQAGRRFLRRPAGLAVLGLAAILGAASALASVVLPTQPSAALARPLSVRVEPPSRTVAPGASASYAVHVPLRHPGRMGLSGRTGLNVKRSGLPNGAGFSFSPQRGLASSRPSRQWTTLTVTTAVSTPPGIYMVRVRARRPNLSGSSAVSLTVSNPDGSMPSPSTELPDPGPPVRAPEAFTIAGTLPAPLTPGTGQPLDLTLTNLESADLLVSSLVVGVASLDAPQSDLGHTCDAADFSVKQFSGNAGFTLPALSTVSLGSLGFTASEWPRVSMLNLPINQDGCKAASLSLSFAGSATEVTP